MAVAQSDPITAKSHAIITDRNLLENSTAPLDDCGRPDVVVVITNKQSAHAFTSGDLNGLLRDGGRVAPSPKRRDDSVTDVPSSGGKKVVQRKSDGRVAHELTIHIGRKKRTTNSVVGEIDPLPIALHQIGPFRPGHGRVEIE